MGLYLLSFITSTSVKQKSKKKPIPGVNKQPADGKKAAIDSKNYSYVPIVTSLLFGIIALLISVSFVNYPSWSEQIQSPMPSNPEPESNDSSQFVPESADGSQESMIEEEHNEEHVDGEFYSMLATTEQHFPEIR